MTKRSGPDEKPSNAELDRQLDNALKDTFPASDPVTIGEPTALVPERPAHRQVPLIDKDLVNELAQHVKDRMAAKLSSAREAPREQDHLKNKKGDGGQRGGVVG